MIINITKSSIKRIVVKTAKILKWPFAIILVAYVLSPSFWTFWRNAKPNSSIILEYVAQLKWVVFALYIFLATRKHIPNIIDRIEEITAWKTGVKLRKPSDQNVPNEDLSKLADSKEPAESTPDAETDNLETIFSTPDVKQVFEQLYNSIYGTQLLVLKRLMHQIPSGLKADDLIDFYDAHLKSSINPYQSFQTFIQFLVDQSLVIYDVKDKKYKITNAGVYFLSYLNDNGKFGISPLG